MSIFVLLQDGRVVYEGTSDPRIPNEGQLVQSFTGNGTKGPGAPDVTPTAGPGPTAGGVPVDQAKLFLGEKIVDAMQAEAPTT